MSGEYKQSRQSISPNYMSKMASIVSRGSRGPVPVFRSWHFIGIVVMVIVAIAWASKPRTRHAVGWG